MWQYNYTDELYHHGVKGMKWGVRRKYLASFRNESRNARRETKLAKAEYKLHKKLGKVEKARSKLDYQRSKDSLRQIKLRERAAKDYVKYGKKLSKGMFLRNAFQFAFDTAGYHKIANAIDKGTDKREAKWQEKYDSAMAVLGNLPYSALVTD